MDLNEPALNLPCKLTWSNSSRTEVRGLTIQLSNADALALLEFGEFVAVPPIGTPIELEILLPENPLLVAKCLIAKGRVERTTEIEYGRQLVTCHLDRTNFRDCTDHIWLVQRRGRAATWSM